MAESRNIGIIAHIDAGKTTTTERILFFAGATHRLGDVDDGTTVTDFDVEEAQRGITIYSACVTAEWRGVPINIIDTPGHVDFTAEVERSLRVLDGAVVVFSAVEGVEAQSETVWRQADRYNVPRIAFINKLDRIGADYERTLKEIDDRLCAMTERQALPVYLPIEVVGGTGFRKLVNVIDRTVVRYSEEAEGWNPHTEDLPAECLEEVAAWRSRLVDAAGTFDDSIMEEFITNGDVQPDSLRNAIRRMTIAGAACPIFCGTSLKCLGVHALLDGVVDFLPSPSERPAVEGKSPDGGKLLRREAADKAPFCGLIFKIVADKHGDLFFVRVYSGVAKAGSRMLNPRTGKKEFVTQIWHIQGSSRERNEGDEAHAGDIVGIVGLKESVTGDTLCDPKEPIVLESIRFPETVISMCVEPESSADREKLELTLNRLALQDPTFTAGVDKESGQTIVSGMGELHLEVIRNRMERDFNLKLRVHRPRVTYKETIPHEYETSGEFDRETSSGPSYAAVKLRLIPDESAAGVVVVNQIANPQYPAVIREALLNAVRDESKVGKYGFALTQLRVEIVDFTYRQGATNETAVYAAVAQAFQSVLGDSDTVVLEPIMKLEVSCPQESVGAIQSDLNMRHALILSSDRRGDFCFVEAEAPLAKMFGYSSSIRSLSQGRAAYTLEPKRYAPATELPDYM